MSLQAIRADAAVWLKYLSFRVQKRKLKAVPQQDQGKLKSLAEKNSAKPAKKPAKRESLEEKAESRQHRLSLKDRAYILIQQMEAFYQHHSGYKHAKQDDAINFYESYRDSTQGARQDDSAPLKEETIRDIIEDKAFRDLGIGDGSGKYFSPLVKEKLDDYKLLFENVIWLRVKYTLTIS